MKELVSANQFGKEVTTSLLVAEVFNKRHADVMRDIENLSCSEEFNVANFGEIEYTDKRNRSYRAYEMTKDGFSFLVMGYTGEKAAQFKEMFIREFNKREALLKSDDYILQRSQEILANRIKLLEEKFQRQNLLLESQAPKVEYYDEVMMSESTMTTTQVAKTLGRSGQWLNRQLKNCGLTFFQSGQWMLKSPYDRCGLHKVRTSTYTKSDGSLASKSATVWTEKGKRFITALNDCGFKLSSAVAIMRQEQGKGAVAI